MANKNPFAQALGATQGNKSSRSFTEALENTGNTGSLSHSASQPFLNQPFMSDSGFPHMDNSRFPSSDSSFPYQDSFSQQRQQKELLEKQEYERKRLELHKKVNPVDQKDIFDAREQATKKKIERIVSDLRKLAREIKKFHKEIDITLMGRVTNPGQEGIGDENFLDKLRAFIILLTQKVRSARTWAQQQKIKNAKKAKSAKGLGKKMTETSGAEQRANMDQFFNSERGDNFGE